MSPASCKLWDKQKNGHISGDIGEWLPNGTLKLIDRKKHIFKVISFSV